jgi:3-oxoacyl-[acyl-carrier protein] reductase
VAPGVIQTWFIDGSPEQFERPKAETPLRRHGKLEEIASVIAFLVSVQSSFVTGETINASGGWNMRP